MGCVGSWGLFSFQCAEHGAAMGERDWPEMPAIAFTAWDKVAGVDRVDAALQHTPALVIRPVWARWLVATGWAYRVVVSRVGTDFENSERRVLHGDFQRGWL